MKKNDNLKPENFTANSNKKVWWKWTIVNKVDRKKEKN